MVTIELTIFDSLEWKQMDPFSCSHLISFVCVQTQKDSLRIDFCKEVTWNLNEPEINVVLFGNCFLSHSIMDDVVNDSLSFGK